MRSVRSDFEISIGIHRGIVSHAQATGLIRNEVKFCTAGERDVALHGWKEEGQPYT